MRASTVAAFAVALLASACPKGSVTDAGVTGDGGTLPDGGIVITLPDGGSTAIVAVTQHHNHASRDGVYVDPLITLASVPAFHVDTGFSATTTDKTFAQPLFMENGPSGKDTLFVATEANDVFALDAKTGAQLWKVNVGTSVPDGKLPCGTIVPLGITGTPVLDVQQRRLYVAAMVYVGTTPKHQIFGINIDTHVIDWTVDVESSVTGFTSNIQNQRSASLLLNNTLYVPYSGLNGDCGNYKGWLVAVNVTGKPSTATAWKTAAYTGSGIWAPSGAASDGTSIFIATGNTNNAGGAHARETVWTNANSEAIMKLTGATPAFSGQTSDYFTMSGPGNDWLANDIADADLGSSGVVLVDAPGATPSHLAFAVGKTKTTYLVNRDNLGGVGTGLGANVTTSNGVFGALFSYNASSGTYVGGHFNVSGCSVGGADVTVLKVSHTSPPALSLGWCAKAGGDASPIVSTSNGTDDFVVWAYGSQSSEVLHAFDGNTGASLFSSSALPGSEHWLSPIIAKGRVYVAGNGTVTALTAQ